MFYNAVFVEDFSKFKESLLAAKMEALGAKEQHCIYVCLDWHC
mgnify:CR=1 FL=1